MSSVAKGLRRDRLDRGIAVRTRDVFALAPRGGVAGEQEVQDAAERIDVAARLGQAAIADHFRGEIRGRAGACPVTGVRGWMFRGAHGAHPQVHDL